MGWIGIATGHEVTVEGTLRPEVACRTAAGRVLAKVPAKVRKDPDAIRLAALCDRLGERARDVHDRVEAWMVRSLPVPAGLPAAVWDDPVWRETLRDLIVAPVVDGAPDLTRCAPLTGPGWAEAEAFAIPHPVLLGDALDGWRRRGLDQAVEQVHREIWTRPAGMDRTVALVDAFGYLDARFESGAAFERHVHELGGRIRGRAARFTVRAPEPLSIEIDLDYHGPMSPVYMSYLAFAAGGREIGDIAWSEGVRILMGLYGARTVDEDGPVLDAAEVYSYYCDGHRGEPGTAAPPADLRLPPRGALLRAGAVLPGPPAPGGGEDACVAVRYEHAVLDAPVVNLVRRAAVEGDKAEMSLYDLDPVAETDAGTVEADLLGFLPAALHRHPAHRARALAAQTELRAARDLAARKPGLARTALTGAGDALEAGAPELLPPFYDECARILAAAGSSRFACAFFEKARAAERAHALPVDEAELVAVHLAAGSDAVGPPTLKAHAGRLAARHAPAGAYRWFLRLLTEWCEAGEDHALVLAAGWPAAAKAAGHTPGGPDDERAVRALLSHGCMESAPQALWTFVLPLLRGMAAADPEIGRAVLGVLPLPAKDTPKAKGAAVSLLLTNLAGTGLHAPFTGVTGARAQEWLGRFLRLYAGLTLPVAGLDDLLRGAGAALRADGLTCDDHAALLDDDDHKVYDFQETDTDFALLDLLVGCGVPVERPRLLHTFKLHDWLAGGGGSDLSALAADPDWGPVLRDAVIGDITAPLHVSLPAHPKVTAPETVRALTGTPGTAGIVADILAAHAGRVPEQGLPDVHAALCDVERFTAGGVPASMLESVRAIVTGADPVRALAAALSGGLLDELELPALSAGHVRSMSDYMEESGRDLLLIEAGRLWDHRYRAAVVTPEGVGPAQCFGTYDFYDDSANVRTEARDLYDRCLIVTGGRVTVVDHGGPHCPHDPAGGVHPAARRTEPADGERVTFPGGAAATVWRGAGRTIELRDAAGRTIGRYVRGWGRAPEHSGANVIGWVKRHRYAVGTALVPPPGWWAAMEPRDPGGSRALRAVGDGTARRLIDVADTALIAELLRVMDPDTGFREQDACFDELSGRLRPLLPEITDEALWQGVTSLVWTAIECRERASALLERLDLGSSPYLRPAPAAAAPAVPRDEPGEEPDPGPDSPYERIVHFARAGARRTFDRSVARFDAAAVRGIENRLGRLGAAVLHAAWSGGGRAELAALAEVPDLVRTDGTWHVARLRPAQETGDLRSGHGPIAIAVVGEQEPVDYYYANTALLYTPGGPDPLLFLRNRVVEVRTCRGWGDPDRLRRAVGLLARNGSPALDREATAAAFAKATGLTAAQCLLLLSTSARDLSWPDGWARGRAAALTRGDAERARALNLTEADLRAAALTLEAMATAEEAVEVVERLMPADPADLWRTGPDLDGAVAYWTGRRPPLAPLTGEQWVTLAAGAEDALPAVIALLGERPSVPPPGHVAEAAKLLGDRLPADHPARTTVAARLRDLREAFADPATEVPIATGITSVDALERLAGATASHLPDGRLAIGDALTAEPAGDGYRVHLRPARFTDLDALAPALRRGGAANAALVASDLRFLTR
ncbi:DUF4132 domain-containing protein [Spirillospora sp. NPDC029432]|uniref:DUF4132 domain-containing protein n=1 Tax=Spirillospora sp. NPDC029432 TaxID=3154599 RepID=UPI0034555EB8